MMKKQKMMRQISKAEALRILSQMKYQKDLELSRGSIGADAYILADGRVLLVSIDWNDEDDQDMIGAIWDSKVALLSGDVKTAGSTHILKGRLPQGQYFVDAVPALIDELALHMQLPRSFFDYSQQSVLELDRLIRERIEPAERIEPPLFACVVAYVSETVRRVTGGRWEMRRPDWTGPSTTDIWEPWIIAPSGKEYAPFTIVFKELYDHSDEIGCLLGAIPCVEYGEQKKSNRVEGDFT